MSPPNDGVTEMTNIDSKATRELNEIELAAVSGGVEKISDRATHVVSTVSTAVQVATVGPSYAIGAAIFALGYGTTALLDK